VVVVVVVLLLLLLEVVEGLLSTDGRASSGSDSVACSDCGGLLFPVPSLLLRQLLLLLLLL